MGEYGYAYKSVSSYTSVRNETRKPAIIQPPFVPSLLPKTSDNHDGYSDGHVTRKTIIPVTSSRPYRDSSTPTSPVGGSPRKVHEFPSPTKPQRSSPMAPNSPDWRQTPQPTSPAYNSGAEGRKPFGSANQDGYDGHGSNGYGSHGDYGGNKEGRKPIESTIRNDNYDSHNGYGSDFGSKKGPHKPISSTIMNNNNHDRHGSNGYGSHGDYGGHKEGRKPIESTIRSDNYDAHNNGYGTSDYGGKKGPHKPIASTIRNDNYDGYTNGTNSGYGGDYGKGHKPIANTIRNDNYDGHNGYGNYNSNKEGHKPIGGGTNHGGYYSNGYGGDKEGRKPIGNYQYDGPNGYGGYGGHDDDHYNNKEGYKPISNPNYYNNGYGTINGKYDHNYNNRDGHGHMQKPVGLKISSAWTAAPRKGTQLSEPTNDIEKALELLRIEAAKREHMHSNNTTDHDYEYQYDRPTPKTHLANWAGPSGPGSNGSRYAGGSSSPQHGSPRVANNKFGNSQPRMSPTTTRDTIFDGRDGGDDYDRDEEYGHVPVIDSRDAEKKFKGTRVW